MEMEKEVKLGRMMRREMMKMETVMSKSTVITVRAVMELKSSNLLTRNDYSKLNFPRTCLMY